MVGLKRLIDELKRRRVFRVAVVYAAVAFVIWQAADFVLPAARLPEWAPTLLLILTILGFPIAVVLAWAYDITPAGTVRTEPMAESAAAEGPAFLPEPSTKTSIVVLPFDNLSPDPADAYFSDGLTEEIITSLAYLRSLRVISRSTAMVLKGSQKDVRTIGRELDVEYVLEGSVRKAGDELRVTAQLIDARSDEHLWAERHEGTMGDILDVQERIANRIVDALRLELSPDEERRLSDRLIADPKAYDTWILAMHEGRKFSAEGVERGIQLAQRGLEIAGDNALLYASLGYLYWGAYDFGVRYQDETLDLAEKYASKALELDPTSTPTRGASYARPSTTTNNRPNRAVDHRSRRRRWSTPRDVCGPVAGRTPVGAAPAANARSLLIHRLWESPSPFGAAHTRAAVWNHAVGQDPICPEGPYSARMVSIGSISRIRRAGR